MIRLVDRSSCRPALMPWGCEVTKVPAPCRTRSIPLSTSRATALRTVGRLTPYSAARSCSEGRRCPGSQWPSAIRWRSRSASWAGSGRASRNGVLTALPPHLDGPDGRLDSRTLLVDRRQTTYRSPDARTTPLPLDGARGGGVERHRAGRLQRQIHRRGVGGRIPQTLTSTPAPLAPSAGRP